MPATNVAAATEAAEVNTMVSALPDFPPSLSPLGACRSAVETSVCSVFRIDPSFHRPIWKTS
jgi:hypothetical protein